jgi:hypothetical protein
MTFFEHLRELFRKLLVAVFAVTIGAGVAHYYHDAIIVFLLKPLHQKKLFFLSPLDPLFFVLKIDFVVGFIFGLDNDGNETVTLQVRSRRGVHDASIPDEFRVETDQAAGPLVC